MNAEVFLIVVVFYGVVIGLPLLIAKFVSPWRYDSRNPYRRYCKKCGQQQDQYQSVLGGTEWCDMSTDHAERHNREQTPIQNDGDPPPSH